MNSKLIVLSTLFSIVAFSQINDAKATMKYALKNGSNDYYRVSVKGFICNRETSDDILERDGKHDEIYLTSLSYLVNSQGNSIPSTAIKTKSKFLGDINGRGPENKWAMAGSAPGLLGGIQSGDQIPDNEPWKNNALHSGDLLPFVLWEGELKQGSDYAVIHPGIMEWDGPADFLTNFWHNSFAAMVLKPGVGIASLPFRALGIGNTDDYNNSPGVFPAPTVMQQFGNIFYRADLQSLSTSDFQKFHVGTDRPIDRPIGVEKSDIFNPLQIRLDYNTATTLSQRDFGYGRGIIPIVYRDREDLKGEYTVFISFEKITDASQRDRMNITHADNFDPISEYSFRSVHASDKETDILNGGMESNTHVVLNNLLGLKSQRWTIKKANQYYFHIKNQYNNLILDLLNQNDINGSNIVTSVPNGNDSQLWSFIRYCDGSWLVRNYKTKRVMEVYNAASNVTAPLGQWDANFARNQRWFIEKK
ncbi:conserved hypothetical protein [Flavobacterium sp. 9AF]|uniref:RICIN domain-containing protein n=1 Tax=Flavobacterium sp. 9AF TaxID=2653142 RepID=UPI0012EF41DB|nr:RICIN domain-containing protein [Flavobacterium sp. 9AF]VXC39802.1 conserved hypothetical protein [Flavobacterium sp. 9AF]